MTKINLFLLTLLFGGPGLFCDAQEDHSLILLDDTKFPRGGEDHPRRLMGLTVVLVISLLIWLIWVGRHKLRSTLEILAIPLVAVFGYALTAMIFFLGVALAAVAVGWLISLNFEGPSIFVIGWDIIAIIGFVWALTHERTRAAAKEFWIQVLRNM